MVAVSRSPSWPESGEVLIADRHRQAGLVDADHRERTRIVRVRERLADRHLGNAGNCDELARPCLVGLDAVERLGHVQLRHLHALDVPVRAAPRHLLATTNRPFAHAAESEATDVRRRVEVRDVRLERMAVFVRRRRDPFEQELEQRPKVVGEPVRLEPGASRPRIRVHDRKLDLALVRVQVEEELVHLVHDLLAARVGPVDLVDDEDHRKPCLERLAQHEARLWKRALAGVDEQQHAVDHRQRALDLAAEVRVAGRVDDVDLDAAVADRGVLREDRDALLALEVDRVEHALGDVLVLAEGAGLPEHGVDERRLAVVDVGDDRDVADVVAERHRSSVPAAYAGR